MSSAMDGIQDAFSTKRLYYVKADPEDANLRAILPQIAHEPVVQALAWTFITRPKGKADFDVLIQTLAKSLLAVSICLRPEEEEARRVAVAGSGEAQQSGEPTNAKPTVIGVMMLGYGGVHPELAVHRRTALGIMLAEPYQGRGYGREAVNWMMDWGFRFAGLHSIVLGVSAFNNKAIRLYKSLGFVEEGRMRESRYFNRKWHDELLFAIKEDEWEKIRGNSGGEYNAQM
ncbi:unnamed protein product [Clonostachys rosea f. rosea IK726]|uniref:Uncharacterized protein n=1 Tax=Clonostachys rosea f. rosea IK726 TaxID=1349383 RepID=A0ACA9TL47_BIOOC|nr:unnamed protein product [Clonostachys rosea f. rosea IK726]